MKTPLKILPCVAVLAIAACADQSRSVTRAETGAFSFATASASTSELHKQTAALNASAERLVRASTMKGAAMGAAIGCGISVLSASNASKCVSTAAIGAVGGAVAGNIKGKRDVTRRIEIADPNKVVRSVRKANSQMTFVSTNLPDHLAEQEAELRYLETALQTKAITPEQHAQRVDLIRQDRAHLAEALSLTTQQAKLAAANLKAAAAEGQTGLDWHILATQDIAKDATSARSRINLL